MTPLRNVLGAWNILRGEKYSSDLAGSHTLWGERYFAGMLMVTSLGIPLLCSVGRLDEPCWGYEDFAGDGLFMAIG